MAKPKNGRRKKRSQYSAAYIEERREEMRELLAQAKTPEAKAMIRKAFDVSVRP